MSEQAYLKLVYKYPLAVAFGGLGAVVSVLPVCLTGQWTAPYEWLQSLWFSLPFMVGYLITAVVYVVFKLYRFPPKAPAGIPYWLNARAAWLGLHIAAVAMLVFIILSCIGVTV